ncbi:hypothetical protein AB1Y20_019116 [Prymnesium parvum]|uniref:Uncharacterized protein n=1 Tax=Prymnesium parvum TaxID=97485 RepID=A0AB34JQB0_PRYPA
MRAAAADKSPQPHRPRACACSWVRLHVALVLSELCAAALLLRTWSSLQCDDWQVTALWNFQAGMDGLDAEDALHAVEPGALSHQANQTTLSRRRLVANDFTADFSRRLAFHRWIELDVVLDRAGYEQYLRRAWESSGLGLSAGRKNPRPRQQPKSSAKLQGDLRASGFRFNAAYFSQEHHQLPGAPWSQGRDQFMILVRHGLRPNHYFFSAGCGPFSLSSHVVRYLLASRYYCIEGDEYLLRAAVEYEIPEAGLIHKRPNFFLHDEPDVASLWRRQSDVTPPSHFDFAVVQQELEGRELEAAVTGIARYLRPRSGRLVLRAPLPVYLERRLGLQQLSSLVSSEQDSKNDATCPLSLSCGLYLYHT